MSKKVLFVDDEPNILDAIKRQLRKKVDLSTAESGAEALEILKKEGPFAVIVSDMRMPEMDGIELLVRVKKFYPDTVRMMLTGNADQVTAVNAVNQGNIFRFMNKPCTPELLLNALAGALEQHRLIIAEKELLNKTLNGTIKVLTEILSLVSPAAFSRAYRIKNHVLDIARKLKLPHLWQYQIAALLSQIGCITLPGEIIDKIYRGEILSDAEEEMYRGHPAAGAKLLANIPRLETVAMMIAEQDQSYREFAGLPEIEDPVEQTILTGGQVLHVAIDFDQLVFCEYSEEAALDEMEKRNREYNPEILAALREFIDSQLEQVVKKVSFMELKAGMILSEDVLTKTGVLVASKGQEVSYAVMQRLRNFYNTIGVVEPIEVVMTERRSG